MRWALIDELHSFMVSHSVKSMLRRNFQRLSEQTCFSAEHILATCWSGRSWSSSICSLYIWAALWGLYGHGRKDLISETLLLWGDYISTLGSQQFVHSFAQFAMSLLIDIHTYLCVFVSEWLWFLDELDCEWSCRVVGLKYSECLDVMLML